MSDGASRRTALSAFAYEARLEVLLNWLSEKNVELSSRLAIQIAPSEGIFAPQDEAEEDNDGFGIYAIQDIPADDILAIIPKQVLLSRRTCSLAQSLAFLQFCEETDVATPHQAGVRILAVALTFEILLGQRSRWYGYIGSMPRSAEEVGLPSFWEERSAIEWLTGTNVLDYKEDQKCKNSEIMTFYRQIVSKLSFHIPDSLDSLHAFQLSLSLVLSRAFYVDNYHGLSMVPLADVFNHHYHPHAILQSDDIVCPACGTRQECEHDNDPLELSQSIRHTSSVISSQEDVCSYALKAPDRLTEYTDSVEMVSTHRISHGEEVFNTYGKLDNASLLVNYGFMLEVNEDDKVRWFSASDALAQGGFSLTDDEQEDLIEQWSKTLLHNIKHTENERVSENRLDNPHILPIHQLLYVDADGDLSIYLWHLLDLGVQTMQHAGTATNIDIPPMPPTTEAAVRQLVQTRLQGYKDAHKSVEELLEDLEAKPTRKVRLAITRVIEERSLLSACLARWEEEPAGYLEDDD